MSSGKGGLIEVLSGAAAQLLMSARAHIEYRKICESEQDRDVKRARSINRFIHRYCNFEPHNLTTEQFKKLGNFPDGLGGKVDIWEFKAFAWRLYGSALNVDGRKTFVGVRVDPDKKQDRSDQHLLGLAAKEVADLDIYRNGQSGRATGEGKNGKQGRKGRKGKG